MKQGNSRSLSGYRFRLARAVFLGLSLVIILGGFMVADKARATDCRIEATDENGNYIVRIINCPGACPLPGSASCPPAQGSLGTMTAPFVPTASPRNYPGSGDFVPCGLGSGSVAQQSPCTICHLLVGFNNMITFGLKFVIIIALVSITIAGLMYIVSAGNESLMQTAKRFIFQVMIGVALVFGAFVIVQTVMNFLGARSDLGIQKANWYTFSCDTSSSAMSSTVPSPPPAVGGICGMSNQGTCFPGDSFASVENRCPSGMSWLSGGPNDCPSNQWCCASLAPPGGSCGGKEISGSSLIRDGTCKTSCTAGSEIQLNPDGINSAIRCSGGLLCCASGTGGIPPGVDTCTIHEDDFGLVHTGACTVGPVCGATYVHRAEGDSQCGEGRLCCLPSLASGTSCGFNNNGNCVGVPSPEISASCPANYTYISGGRFCSPFGGGSLKCCAQRLPLGATCQNGTGTGTCVASGSCTGPTIAPDSRYAQCASTAVCCDQSVVLTCDSPERRPRNLMAGTVTESQITITWSCPTECGSVSGYRIYLNGNFQANKGINDTVHTFSALNSNQTYAIEVRAVVAGNECGSAQISATTLGDLNDSCASGAGTCVTPWAGACPGFNSWHQTPDTCREGLRCCSGSTGATGPTGSETACQGLDSNGLPDEGICKTSTECPAGGQIAVFATSPTCPSGETCCKDCNDPANNCTFG